VPDVLSIVIILVDLLTSGFVPFLRALFYIKAVTIIEINREISYRLVHHRSLIAIFRYFKYTFFLVYITFFFSSIYVAISLTVVHQDGWAEQNGFAWLTASPSIKWVNLYENFQWYVWFEYALFLYLQTVRGCGYGVAVPRNPSEMLFVALSTPIVFACFAYYVKGIGNLMEKHSRLKTEINNEVTILSRVRDEGDLPSSLYRRHRYYLIESAYRHKEGTVAVMESALSA
jgi:hypothetical protein